MRSPASSPASSTNSPSRASAPRALGGLADDAYDRFFAITAHFLRIALRAIGRPSSAARGCVDGAARQTALIEAQIDASRRAARRAGRSIALGSTGAHPATARLLAAIARLERGAVVLPGLDLEMDEAAWRRVGEPARRARGAGLHPSADHAEAAARRHRRRARGGARAGRAAAASAGARAAARRGAEARRFHRRLARVSRGARRRLSRLRSTASPSSRRRTSARRRWRWRSPCARRWRRRAARRR